jgi:glutathione S-transferase
MTVKIYGLTASRALRNLWMLEELRVPYSLVETDFRTGATRTPEYLRLNPNARIPALEDGDTVLFESMAINLYLALKHGGPLWPKDPDGQGRVLQWTLWAVNELEHPLVDILLHRMFLPEPERNPTLVRQALDSLPTRFRVLDSALENRQYLLGEGFTLGDLNVAIVMNYARMARIDLIPYPHLARWLDRCLSRPALKSAQGLQAA